jgi:hypothetical protein
MDKVQKNLSKQGVYGHIITKQTNIPEDKGDNLLGYSAQ